MLTVGNNALPGTPPMSTTSYVHQTCKLANPAILEEFKNKGADMNGGKKSPDPPAAMVLAGIWHKNRPRQRIDDSFEVGFGHLEFLLDFRRRAKATKITLSPQRSTISSRRLLAIMAPIAIGRR